MSPPPEITIFWESPQGRVRIGITHIKGYHRGRDQLEIRALDPDDARLPFTGAGFHEGLYRAADIHNAGGVARFVERLILDAARASPEASAPSRHMRGRDTDDQPPVTSPHATTAHPLENKLLSNNTYQLAWHSPTGPAIISITHTRTFFHRAHMVDIAVPPNTPFPLDTLSYIVTDADLARAGNAKAFVESLIASAEGTAAWRTYAARAAQTDLFGAPATGDAPARSRPRRPRLKLPAPRR